MRYFSGFSLEKEKEFFERYLVKSELCVAGFSYGAQRAFEYVYQSQKRVDRLILLSPAFFQEEKASFARTQLRYFEADREAYIAQFLQNTAFPSKKDLSSYVSEGEKEALAALLSYRWEANRIKTVLERGTVIEVFLGAKDKIVNTEKAYAFFHDMVTCYYLKDAGHLLMGK